MSWCLMLRRWQCKDRVLVQMMVHDQGSCRWNRFSDNYTVLFDLALMAANQAC